MKPLVSIIIPVVRPEKARRCIEAILNEACGITVQCGPYEHHMGYASVEIISEVDTERIGCPRMVKRLVERTKGPYICFLGDDTVPVNGWLEAALKAMATLPDGWGLVGFNDGIHNGRIATHWLADRRLLEHLDGEFFHTGYHHLYCDQELTERCREMGRYVYAPEAIIVHDHPATKEGRGVDDDYRRVYESNWPKEDQALFWKRKRERMGFKLGIGFPVVNEDVPMPFFLSVMEMKMPAGSVVFTPTFPHGPMPHDIAAARESLVHQAMEEGCTHLAMMDTDQIYPADTLEKLLGHDKPVVGVRVHRRWPPYEPIFKRGTLGDYHYVGDDLAFSGELVEVDATGTGCLLFKMEVFDQLERPWFTLGSRDGKPVGEDIWLCHRLRGAGIPIFIDTSIEVGHMTTHVVGRGTYMLYSQINPELAPH